MGVAENSRRFTPVGMLAAALGLTVVLLALAPTTASAQPLTCGQVITKETTLHADLGPCPGDGLVIGANKVTLDLNGHAITGDDTSNDGGDVGVRNDEGHDGTVVENGEIRGFSTSIRLDGADGSRVSHITETETSCCHLHFVEVLDSRGSQIENNVSFGPHEESVFVVSGSRNSLENNIVARDSADDIASFSISGSHNRIRENTEHGGGGMRVRGSRNRVTHNQVSEGERPPLSGFLVEGARNLIARNSLGDLEGTGVVGPGNVIRNNVVGIGPNASITGGLHAIDCRNVRIEGNVVYNAIVLAGCQDARVVNNSVPASGIEGIRVDGGSGNLIEDNTVSETELSGIILDGGSENVIQRNAVSDTAGSGILVGPFFDEGGSVETVVKGNLVTRAGSGFRYDDGIHVEDAGTVIADNRANHNFDLGIQAVPGVIDGGGNTAFGNGNPLQCLNVVCN